MFIQVLYQNNEYSMVKPFLLDELIASGKIKKFLRSEGWATIGIDSIRGTGGYYSGQDRRNKSVFESLNDEDKTKDQLLDELARLRHRVDELEQLETENRKLVDALRISKKKYRNIVDFTYDCECLLDPDGHHIYVSPSCKRITGYRVDEFMLDPNLWVKIAHPDDRDILIKHFKEALQNSNDIFHIDFRIVTHTGEVRWISHNCQSIYDDDGTWLGRRASNRDITDRKKAEDALRVSEEKYRTVADFTYDWEDWIDPYGKYIYISPSCEWITGYSPDEFMADPDLLIKIAHPDDRNLVEKHVHEILSGSIDVHHIDFRIINRSGEIYWISHYCQPVYGKDGNFLGRRGSSRDITKRKEAEEELKQLTNDLKRFNIELSTINDQLETEMEARLKTEKALKESEERYKSMVSAVTMYTYSVDLSQVGAISTQHSIGCIPITGYNPEDYESDSSLWHKMIYPDDKMIVENLIIEILAGHKVSPIEHRIIRRDGKVVWVRNTMVPFYDVNGRLIRYDGLIEDITERKLAEEKIQKLNEELGKKLLELAESNKELEAFNRSVSHDLQTPLLVIGGFARRFLKVYGDKLDTDEIDIINTIQISAQKMERLIKDLLAFSRSGRQEIKPVKIDMRNLITTVLNELKTISEGRMIKFDIKVLPPAYGDISLLKQVIVNLLSNAIKFTQSKDMAVIEVGCRVEENENIYYVKDNGIGLYPQYTDKLFSPFYRLPDAKEFEGTGIGLSIVQRIVNRHGGRVWAEGKGNEGAIFYFSLPRKFTY